MGKTTKERDGASKHDEDHKPKLRPNHHKQKRIDRALKTLDVGLLEDLEDSLDDYV